MSARVRDHIRSNVVGYIALFCFALGGTAYATHPGGANTISTGDIQDGQVQNADLGSGAVTGAKVFPSTLDGSKVAPSGLTGFDIAADSLTSSDIGTGAVGSSEVANGSLGTTELASSIPAARVTRNTSQGVLHATSTVLNFNSERYDTASMHSNSTNISRVIAPVTGIYETSASIMWFGPNTAGQRNLHLRKNGSTFLASEGNSGGEGKLQSIGTVTRLEAGDFVEVLVSQTSGQTLSVFSDSANSETSPEVSMTWLAPGP